jgi:hypothetical protein
MSVSGHFPADLPLVKNRYPFYSKVDGPQGRSGRMQNILPPPEIDPRTVRPAAGYYTECTPGCSNSNFSTYKEYLSTSIGDCS